MEKLPKYPAVCVNQDLKAVCICQKRGLREDLERGVKIHSVSHRGAATPRVILLKRAGLGQTSAGGGSQAVLQDVPALLLWVMGAGAARTGLFPSCAIVL